MNHELYQLHFIKIHCNLPVFPVIHAPTHPLAAALVAELFGTGRAGNPTPNQLGLTGA